MKLKPAFGAICCSQTVAFSTDQLNRIEVQGLHFTAGKGKASSFLVNEAANKVLSTVRISTEPSIVSQSLKCFGCKASLKPLEVSTTP